MSAATAAFPTPRLSPLVGIHRWQRTAAVAVVVLAVATRLPHVLTPGVPAGDGGLFYLMAQALASSFPRLPETVEYGALQIPFAYPPLGFYLSVIVDRLGPWGLLDVLRFLPLAFSVLTVVAAWLLLRELCPWPRWLVALLFFTLLPRSWNWEVVGGGITRSPGLFFLLLSMQQGVRAVREEGGRFLPLWAALAVLTHPEMGLMALAHPFLFAVALGRPEGRRRALLRAAAGSLLALALASPWWAYALIAHGPDILLGAASGSRYGPLATLLPLVVPFFYGEPGLPWLAAWGLAGVLLLAWRRQFFPLGWLVFLFLLDPRKAATIACLPLALGGAWAAERLWHTLRPRCPSAPALTLATLVLLGAVQSGMAHLSPLSPLNRLTKDDLAAMVWLRENAPAGARVLVLSGLPWASDPASEWLPALTGLESVLTVQGSEWLGRATFLERQQAFAETSQCLRKGDCSGGELAQWHRADYVFVYSGCRCPRALEGLEPLLPGALYVPTVTDEAPALPQ
ncbi:MAG: glycosyltransferase family 39 protein [Dehalococcoidia bacterium]|nr:glycosyltransferase family 39 protein [Dehalococcoidia bacterium]